METMLYKYPATEAHLLKVEVDGDKYHYQIVTDDLVDEALENGWFKHFNDAKKAKLDDAKHDKLEATTSKKKKATDGVD